MSSSANALRDLARIQKLQRRKAKRQLKEQKDAAKDVHAQAEQTMNVMRFIVDALKKEPDHQMVASKLGDKLKEFYSENNIVTSMKTKTLLNQMEKQNLIHSTLTNGGVKRVIQLLSLEEKIERELMNHKQQSIKWYDEHQREIEELEQCIIKILNKCDGNEMRTESFGRVLGENYGKTIKKIKKLFGVKDAMDIWRHLEKERRLISVRTSLDQRTVSIKLNEEFVQIEEPPFKKKKIEKYINEFNEGKMSESKLTKKILKQMDRLEEKCEIHFHFQLDKPQIEQDLSDSEMDSDMDDSSSD